MPIHIQPQNFKASKTFVKKLFIHKIDKNIELRLYEPYHAEELNRLIEQNKAHIKKWSAWLKDDRSIENTPAFIKRNLKQFSENKIVVKSCENS